MMTEKLGGTEKGNSIKQQYRFLKDPFILSPDLKHRQNYLK